MSAPSVSSEIRTQISSVINVLSFIRRIFDKLILLINCQHRSTTRLLVVAALLYTVTAVSSTHRAWRHQPLSTPWLDTQKTASSSENNTYCEVEWTFLVYRRPIYRTRTVQHLIISVTLFVQHNILTCSTCNSLFLCIRRLCACTLRVFKVSLCARQSIKAIPNNNMSIYRKFSHCYLCMSAHTVWVFIASTLLTFGGRPPKKSTSKFAFSVILGLMSMYVM